MTLIIKTIYEVLFSSWYIFKLFKNYYNSYLFIKKKTGNLLNIDNLDIALLDMQNKISTDVTYYLDPSLDPLILTNIDNFLGLSYFFIVMCLSTDMSEGIPNAKLIGLSSFMLLQLFYSF